MSLKVFSILRVEDAISMRIAFTILLGNPTPIPSIYMHHTATSSLAQVAGLFSMRGRDLSPEVFPFQMMRFDVRSVSGFLLQLYLVF
jgi:hypothetical protein